MDPLSAFVVVLGFFNIWAAIYGWYFWNATESDISENHKKTESDKGGIL